MKIIETTAFPILATQQDPMNPNPAEPQPGMLLLDYFAAMHMQGCMAYGGEHSRYNTVAEKSYECAVAMMNARDKAIKELF